MRLASLLLIGLIAGGCGPTAAPSQTAAQSASPASTPGPSPTLARPSPTLSASASPSPSPAPTGATGTPPPTACPPQNGGDPAAQAQLTAIRTAHQTGFDRVVFEFGPSPVGSYGMPLYDLAVVTQFVGGGSGAPVPVKGNAFLQVRFRNASTVDPTTGKQTFTQTDIRPDLPLVFELKLIDDFERVMTWGLGLQHLACAKVTELAGPVRLVVDLPTPP